MADPSKVSVELAGRYADSPAIRALVQLIPFGVGSAVDVAVVEKLQSIREDRVRTFFDQLAAGDTELTSEVIESEDFLHCYFSTVAAALRSRRREKVAMLATLLIGGVRECALGEGDDYEELLTVIDSMSLREIKALFIIGEEEGANSRLNEDNDLTWAKRHRPRIVNRFRDELGIPESEVANFVQRLSRTGLVEEVTFGDEVATVTISTGWDAFRVTNWYRRLLRLVRSGQESNEAR